MGAVLARWVRYSEDRPRREENAMRMRHEGVQRQGDHGGMVEVETRDGTPIGGFGFAADVPLNEWTRVSPGSDGFYLYRPDAAGTLEVKLTPV